MIYLRRADSPLTARGQPLLAAISIVVLLILLGRWEPAKNQLAFWSTFSAGPVWQTGNAIENNTSLFLSFFKSKEELAKENRTLKNRLAELEGRMAEYRKIKLENESLWRFFSRFGGEEKSSRGVGRVMVNPWRTPYGILIVEAEGAANNISAGALVAFGGMALGEVREVLGNKIKADLFSSPGTELLVGLGEENIPALANGLGRGKFSVRLPRSLEVKNGEAVIALEKTGRPTVGLVEATKQGEDNSFQTIYFGLPFNINQLMLVEIYVLAEAD